MEEDEFVPVVKTAGEQMQKVSQDQIHTLLFGEQLSWQAIIYDLINTEQLDPWDIDLSLLSLKFLERVRALEEANFFISSKVLLAAALLLRMKSEILLDYDIAGLDAILFGKKEQKSVSSTQERLILDDIIPDLVARTPLPRFKRVTLEELMKSLDQAIKTENRRIKRIVVARQQEFETALSLPKQRINLVERLREVYNQLQNIFTTQQEKLAFSSLSLTTSEERIATFIPLLHLDHQRKVWIEQESHLGEIWILLQEMYDQLYAKELHEQQTEAASAIQELTAEEQERSDHIEQAYEDMVGAEPLIEGSESDALKFEDKRTPPGDIEDEPVSQETLEVEKEGEVNVISAEPVHQDTLEVENGEKSEVVRDEEQSISSNNETTS